MPTPDAMNTGREALSAAVYTPSSWWFDGADTILVQSLCSIAGVTIAITGEMMGLDGRPIPFRATHVPNSNRTLASSTLYPGVGWLVNVSAVVVAGAPIIGQCLVFVHRQRGQSAGAQVLSTIVEGYITAVQDVTYPGASSRSSLEGPGALRSIAGTDPPANTEIVETVPAGARWRLIAVEFRLVTDANVAVRVVSFTIDDGAAAYFILSAVATQSASQTFDYCAATIGAAPSNADNRIFIPLPADVRLLAGHRFRTQTLARQVGDNFGAPQYLVEEWLEAA